MFFNVLMLESWCIVYVHTHCDHYRIDLELILDLHAYDTSERYTYIPIAIHCMMCIHCIVLPHRVLSQITTLSEDNRHHIDEAVCTVTFEIEKDVVEEQLDQWLQVCKIALEGEITGRLCVYRNFYGRRHCAIHLVKPMNIMRMKVNTHTTSHVMPIVL